MENLDNSAERAQQKDQQQQTTYNEQKSKGMGGADLSGEDSNETLNRSSLPTDGPVAQSEVDDNRDDLDEIERDSDDETAAP
jgi:hypothetical protein